MGFFSTLFGLFGGRKSGIRTSFRRPFQIPRPRIGFLNLLGPEGAVLVETDQHVLGPLFHSSQIVTDVVPSCEVLFIYCTLNPQGKVLDSQFGVYELARQAGAYVAVVASENHPDHYVSAMRIRSDWKANIVLIIERKADDAPRFFRQLFTAMFGGKSMPTAWVELAPQIPGLEHADGPVSIMVADAGHLTFGRIDAEG
jgi:hypothetical protein